MFEVFVFLKEKDLAISVQGDQERVLSFLEGLKGEKLLVPTAAPESALKGIGNVIHLEGERTLDPKEIEERSYSIIEKLLPEGFSSMEKKVASRMIHASGDPMVARMIKISKGAVEKGVDALRKVKKIITDTKMVAWGINKKLLEKTGCEVVCALELAEGKGKETRSYKAFKILGDSLKESIVAIGNAPTALMACLEMAEEGVTPSLIIGTPVGFVQAREAKELLAKSPIPHITLLGTRGGSSIAAAAINALLSLV